MADAMKIDSEIQRQIEAIVDAKIQAELIRYGIIDNQPELSYEEAKQEFLAFLEKGRNSPISPLSHDEIWDFSRILERVKARRK